MKKATGFYPRVHVDAAGSGVVSQAGGVTLVEAVRVSGINRGLSVALEAWRKPAAVHDPAKVLVDLAVMLALGGDALADVLQQDGFPASRRGDDQGALASAQRGEQVHHAVRERLGADFQLQPGLGIDGRFFVEGFDFRIFLGRHAFDFQKFAEPGSLVPPRALHQAAEVDALAEAVFFDHAAGHEGIGQFADVIVVRIAEETVAVGVHLQHAAAGLERADFAVVGRSIGEGDALVVVSVGRRPVPRLRTEAIAVVLLLHARDAAADIIAPAAFLSLSHDHNPCEVPLHRYPSRIGTRL